MDVKAKKHQTTQAMKKLCDIDVAKVNTLIRPETEKKVYMRLALDYGSGCYQQNWGCLNYIQFSNSKYVFHH